MTRPHLVHVLVDLCGKPLRQRLPCDEERMRLPPIIACLAVRPSVEMALAHPAVVFAAGSRS